MHIIKYFFGGVPMYHLKRLWLLLSFPCAAVLISIARSSPSFSEAYAKGFYYRLSLLVNRITGLVPFSVSEILVYIFIVLIVFYIVHNIIKIIKGKTDRAETAVKFFANAVCAAGIIFLLYTLNCGINYYRYTFADTCGLNVKPSPKSELVELCSSLENRVNGLRPKVKTDKNSVMELSKPSIYDVANEAKKSYDKLNNNYPLLHSGYSSPKPVYFSKLMSYADITGMFFPFTFESDINTDVPAYTIPATMCHELSHLRGYMREDEANFIGYLACTKSADNDFRYSGDMLAFAYASSALYSSDSKAADKIFSGLNGGVKRDLAYNNAYWKQFEGPVADVSQKVNDNYLKANSQQDGVKSYGRMVDLLLAQQRAEKSGGSGR